VKLFTTEAVRKPKWTGNVLPVLSPPRCPVKVCGHPLTTLPAVTQPALFLHGGFGAAERTTLRLCCACLWVGTARVESVSPRRL